MEAAVVSPPEAAVVGAAVAARLAAAPEPRLGAGAAEGEVAEAVEEKGDRCRRES